MIKLLLVRHGETDFNKAKIVQGHKNIDLNKNGIYQAIELGKFMLDNDIKCDEIYSSPLIRAQKTANLIKEYAKLTPEIVINSSIIERDFKEYEGANITSEIVKKLSLPYLENTEQLSDVYDRAYNFINNLKDNNQTVLIVTHSHVIRTILKHIDENYTFKEKLDNCKLVELYFENGNFIKNKE